MKYKLVDLRRLLPMHPHAKAPFIYPAREWALGLLIGVCVFVAGIVHGSVLFLSASSESETGMSTVHELGPLPYKDHEVRKVLETYDARARVFKEMRGTLLVSTSTPSVESETSEVPEVPEGTTPVAQ